MSEEKTILLIEDDEFIGDMYKSKFEETDYNFRLAQDGGEGENMIYDLKPDLVLLDIILPKKDGFEILEKIKEDEEVKDIPVIILTNLGQDKNIKKGRKLGATDYIVKAHYTPSEVVDKVNNHF